ncbi:HAMP domain-containing histidine kinase [Filobacillus milosensis]|uniref:Signal transduction histidine-protein kinase ArlS n=1 Tax=Filobacillus milosensis TaxID=94137 RepID=A0A4Y8IDL6_9BACI|nr:HAMP domain-containing histidine kinase [Filobacillus milosensis]TFB14082.1 HAMP domain-containing histidine kinase [Filobacillus milosensis]
MRLKNKIFLYSTFLFIVIIVLLSLTIYFTFSDITYEREMERIESNADNIVSGLREANEEFTVDDLLSVYTPSNGMLRIVNRNGETMTFALSEGEPISFRKVDTDFERGRQSKIINHEDKQYGLVQIPLIWQKGQVVYLQIFESLKLAENNLNTLKLVLLLVTVIAIIPIIVSGKLLSDLIITPIQTLINTMKEIKESNSFKHIPSTKQSKDELNTMSETFNDLMDRLKENYDKQEAFVSNASHELRTPLTIIESYANLVKRRGLEQPELVKESIEAIHTEAIRMRDLTEQLLLLARRDKDWLLENEEHSLDNILKDVANHFKEAYHREIKIIINESSSVLIDEQKLKQLLYIFLDNARKYSDDYITLSMGKESKQPIIKIIDRGIGIPEQSQEEVFERFYRVDEARNRDQGGTGLGLAVAKELADAMNITIDLKSKENQGTTVILRINSSNSH